MPLEGGFNRLSIPKTETYILPSGPNRGELIASLGIDAGKDI